MANFFDRLLSKVGVQRIKDTIVDAQAPDYRAGHDLHHHETVSDLPHFRLHHAVTMTTDPVVQFGLHVRDALISPSDVEFETKNPDLGAWLRKQWDVIWGKNWFKVTQAKQWGYTGLEVLMDVDETTGYIDVTGLKDFAPHDTRALVSDGDTVGLTVTGHLRRSHGSGNRQILMPQALWTSFGSRWGNPYGNSILRGAQSPWWEKWMKGGVKKVTQLRMIKDAYRGMIGWYPLDETFQDKNGNQISYRDVIRESLENVNAGGSISLPLAYDSNGNKRFDITDQPQGTDPSAIFEWGSRTDREIWFALDVPQEIIEAASTGSGFSGRSIPFVVALQLIGGREFTCYLESIDRMVLRPLAQLNFGNSAAAYTVTPKSLPEIYAGMLEGSAMGGGAVGGTPSQIAGPAGVAMEESGRAEQIGEPGQGSGGQFAESSEREDLLARIETAASETDTDPTDEQKEAGNYRKGKFSIHGMRFAIENPKGTIRSGKDWQVTMPAHYGYILKTESEADGDHVDCFIGESPESEIVFVIDQVTASGRFDEHKCMVGFTSEKQARETYAAAFTANWRVGPITAMTLDDFREWLKRGDTGHRLENQVHNLAFAEFDESKVKREAKGTEGGGRFTGEGGGDIRSSVADNLTALERSSGKSLDAIAESAGFVDSNELFEAAVLVKEAGFGSFGEAQAALGVATPSLAAAMLQPAEVKADPTAAIVESPEERSFIDAWARVSPIGEQGVFADKQAEVREWISDPESSPEITAVYNATQARLKEQGITEIDSFRGIVIPKDHPLAVALANGDINIGQSVSVDGMTAVSYSEKSTVASRFASPNDPESEVGIIVKRTVPAADVIASHRTQKGFLRGEEELVGKSQGNPEVEITGFVIDGKLVQ